METLKIEIGNINEILFEAREISVTLKLVSAILFFFTKRITLKKLLKLLKRF